MPQTFACPHCRTQMTLPDGSTGKAFRCPNSACQKTFTVAAAREPVASSAAKATVPPRSAPPLAPAPSARTSPAPMPHGPPPLPPSPGLKSTPPAAPNACPACGESLLPGAIACMDCGFLLTSADAGPVGGDGPALILCSNPACGVANAPGERNCVRCSSPLPRAPGTVLHGRYKIERLLAVGGFGAVYLAVDLKNDDRPVAIKDMICVDPLEFAIRLNFFRREYEILKSLAVLSIVPRVYELIEQKDSAHLAMEYIRGRDLLKLMEENDNKPFPVDMVIEWSKQICDVLTHMHSQTPTLVHRDLKAENVMLLEDKRSIKLIDFGTARDLGRTQKEKKADKTRVFTEGYAPLEQIVGKPEARSDLFALAGTMYHLVTGKAPEGSHTAREIDTQLNEPNGVAEDLRWFYELIKINLAEDLNERYFSAREIRADLEKRRVTREVSCPKCKAMNKAREPYCSKCAEALTDATPPCHHCGKSNQMGSRCCIYCGNRLR